MLLLALPAIAFSQPTPLQRADSLNRAGMEYYNSGHYRQAELDLEQAFRLYESHTKPEAWLAPGTDYAEILVDRAKYEEALKLFNRLKTIAVSARNMPLQARIENDLGWLQLKMGHFETALDHLKDAIPLARQAKDTLRLGYIHDNIGGIYRRQGKYDQALRYHKQALPYYQQLRNERSIAICLNNIGLTYKQLSLFDRAIEYYERSLEIRKKLDNVDLMASIHSNIGGLYRQLGDYDKALVHYQTSMQYRNRAGDPLGTAYTLNNIAILYGALGQNERALEYYHQSLERKRPYANNASLAVTYANIGDKYWEQGQREKAVGYHREALKLIRTTGNQRRIASYLFDLIDVELQLGELSSAGQNISRTAVIADSTGDARLLQQVALRQGWLERARGRPRDAIRHYRQALRRSGALERNAALLPLKNLAYTYEQTHPDSAIYFGQQAITIIEEARRQTGSLSEFRSSYFKQHADFYVDLAGWVLRYQQQPGEAFRLVELAKARSLADELEQAAQRMDQMLPEARRIERARRLNRISSLYDSLNRAGTRDTARIEQQIRDAELDYAAFENKLQRNYPRYRDMTPPEPISLESARRLFDRETAILQYALNQNRLIIFLIGRDGVTTHQQVFDEDGQHNGLLSHVRQFRDAIVSRQPEDSLERLSRPLYRQLIAPVEPALDRYANILISPDRGLAYLPFEVLTKNNDYLVSSFNIKYIPSLTGYTLVTKPREFGRSLLAIGNPDRYAERRNLPELPTVRQEVASLANLFGTSTTMMGEQLSEKAVQKEMQEGYSYIHIAAHSVIDEQNSSLSGILLNAEEKLAGVGNDGYLRSSEIYLLNAPTNMVVLSACKSGVGNVVSGEGMLGLQRAFFNAGASAVVVSLWDVYDRPTTHFMKQFYTQLEAQHESWSDQWQSLIRWIGWDESEPFGRTAESMRAVKLAMLDHPEYRHPVFWAPFITVGR